MFIDFNTELENLLRENLRFEIDEGYLLLTYQYLCVASIKLEELRDANIRS